MKARENNLAIYTTEEIDNDGSYYLKKKVGVEPYDWSSPLLNDIFRRFKQRNSKGLYIIGNYLYFTLNGAYFYISLTSFSAEWKHIADLISEIRPYAKHIAYEYGRLD